MPYSSNDDLPASVKSAYSDRCQSVFRDAYNGSAKAGHDEGRCMATAHTAAKNCMSHTKAEPVKATLLDDDAFRLLAIPFGGPIPSRLFPRGVDVDGETFTERTDIKASWLSERLVDWHHGADGLMGRTVVGKAVDPIMDEDGWWVTVWTKHGERRLELIRRLAERTPIYGSSESIAGMVRKASTGEILVWPYWRQTLSTSPQNTKSVLRPLKAAVDELYATGVTPTSAFWADVAADLTALESSLQSHAYGSDDAVKAGRVLSAANEAALRKAIDDLAAVLDGMLPSQVKE